MPHTFVALPPDYQSVMLFDQEGKKVRQVLWGDFLHLDADRPDTDPQWRHIIWSPKKQKLKLKIRREHTTDKRPLEIIFVDVGQGDGCVLFTPERDANERIIVIDAGKSTEMIDFLRTRFGAYKDQTVRFHAAVITHPDEDHYGGFGPIFSSGNFKFKHVYHSGLVERPVTGDWAKVGGKPVVDTNKVAYIGPLVEDDATMRQIFSGPANRMEYATVIKAALDNDVVDSFEPLTTAHGQQEEGKTWVPGFAPSNQRGYEIEVLGPFVEQDSGGQNRLRKMGKYSETKNGHSVLLRLTYGDFSVLFGGDLNVLAEKFLLTRYAGIDEWPEGSAREAMLAAARSRFRSDVLKVCHHGSADVTDEFLEAVNPAAFVISSGDEEGHVHPRPDLLGRLGRKGRGAAPVLLSTELQRSSRNREDERMVAQLTKDINDQIAMQTDERSRRIAATIRTLGGGNVDVDGAIYLKSDGERLITAFKKEAKSDKDKWFYFEYRLVNGELLLAPR